MNRLDLSTRESAIHPQLSHPKNTHVRGDVVDVSAMSIEVPICFLQVRPDDRIPLHPSCRQSLILLAQFFDHSDVVVVGIATYLLSLVNSHLHQEKTTFNIRIKLCQKWTFDVFLWKITENIQK